MPAHATEAENVASGKGMHDLSPKNAGMQEGSAAAKDTAATSEEQPMERRSRQESLSLTRQRRSASRSSSSSSSR